MDPYSLFSTPPGDMVMSSTPLKQKGPKTSTPAKNKEGKGGGKKALTPAKANQQSRLANRSSMSLCTPTAIKKRKQTNKKQKKENLWDQHLKNNPELAQFVDQFNHSLEDATSKPLDMS